MASLCPRCGTHERTLESLGVFRCPACGRVNADGELIPEGASEPARFAVRTGEGSFAAPPPVAPKVSGTRAPFPRVAIVLMAALAFLTVVDLALSGSEAIMRATLRLGILGGLVVGDRDAYRAACVGWLVSLAADVYTSAVWWPAVGLAARGILAMLVLLDVSFLAALLSRDMRQRYEKPTVA
ncbi:MAG: hypothetical protein U0234_05590 [Sandaracinus sp.]